MTYSEMTDFEIDKAVADALGLEYEEAVMFVSPVDKENGNHVESYINKKVTNNKKYWKRFSPSKSWADAGPIISENKINLQWVFYDSWDARAWYHTFHECIHKNPLRAAMIVFLMMQEKNNA